MPPAEGAVELVDPLAQQATWLDERVAVLETREGFPSANSLLLADGDETVLVDAGLDEEALASLAPMVDRLVVTHVHLDHVIRVDALPDVPVLVPEAERAVFEGAPFHAFAGADETVAERFEATFGDIYPDFDLDPATFEPGDTLELAGTRWEIVPAAGHSPGHSLLHERERSILFSVDVEFSGTGPWYAWPHCDPTAFEQAVEDARGRFLEARAVATSHSPPIVDAPDAVEAALDAFQACYADRDETILAALAARGEAGARGEALVDEARLFYGPHVEKNPAIRYWTRVMTAKHLERLAEQGRAARDGERWVAVTNEPS